MRGTLWASQRLHECRRLRQLNSFSFDSSVTKQFFLFLFFFLSLFLYHKHIHTWDNFITTIIIIIILLRISSRRSFRVYLHHHHQPDNLTASTASPAAAAAAATASNAVRLGGLFKKSSILKSVAPIYFLDQQLEILLRYVAIWYEKYGFIYLLRVTYEFGDVQRWQRTIHNTMNNFQHFPRSTLRSSCHRSFALIWTCISIEDMSWKSFFVYIFWIYKIFWDSDELRKRKFIQFRGEMAKW